MGKNYETLNAYKAVNNNDTEVLKDENKFEVRSLRMPITWDD